MSQTWMLAVVPLSINFETTSAGRGSAGPPQLDHDTCRSEPLDCGIVEAMLAQPSCASLREFVWY
jgi:hypothetical protein